MPEDTNLNLAVLIDADNASASTCAELLAEVAKYGIANVKRAYGDWTTNTLSGWKAHLHKHAIQPMQQFRYTVGKNATDSFLIIDAMDLLHEGRLDGFCIVSSDSDFTRLATRLREAGMVVYGFGENKTPAPFIAACDKFIYMEILKPKSTPKVKLDYTSGSDKDSDKESTVDSEVLESDPKKILQSAIDAVSRDDGWAALASIGHYINKNPPSFDSRNYGYEKLGQLVKNTAGLEVDEKSAGDGSHVVHIFVRSSS